MISFVVWPSISVALGTIHIVCDLTVQHVCELVVVVAGFAVSAKLLDCWVIIDILDEADIAELLEGWVIIDPIDDSVELVKG